MAERERDPFPDWDNPEDFDEGAPEGYYDDEEDEGYIPEPGDPDYDLSEQAGYSGWEAPKRAFIPQWAVAAICILLILAFLTPLLIRIS